MADWWSRYITQRAPKHGIDPRAALAVAHMEGLSGGVGDAGTSFGPFQLHIGGANPYSDPRRARSFAESEEGINYALRKMAESGARGLKGRAAIESIVSRFERPADPASEIAGAWARYGGLKMPAAGPGAPPAGPPARLYGTRGELVEPTPERGPPRLKIQGGGIDSNLLAQAMLSGMDTEEAIRQASTPWSFTTKRAPAPPVPKGKRNTKGTVDTSVPVVEGTPGSAKQFKPGGGWGGSKGVAQGFRDLAASLGLGVMSEKRDRRSTASGGVSDHWTGSKNSYAFDLSNGSNPTPEMDTAAREIMGRLGVSYDGKGRARQERQRGWLPGAGPVPHQRRGEPLQPHPRRSQEALAG